MVGAWFVVDPEVWWTHVFTELGVKFALAGTAACWLAVGEGAQCL